MFKVPERRVACSKNGCFVCFCIGLLVVTDFKNNVAAFHVQNCYDRSKELGRPAAYLPTRMFLLV